LNAPEQIPIEPFTSDQIKWPQAIVSCTNTRTTYNMGTYEYKTYTYSSTRKIGPGSLWFPLCLFSHRAVIGATRLLAKIITRTKPLTSTNDCAGFQKHGQHRTSGPEADLGHWQLPTGNWPLLTGFDAQTESLHRECHT